MRILVVSKHFPEELSTKVHGVYKRFQMFIDALKDSAQIDLLYYVPPEIDTSPSSVEQFEQTLSTHFNTRLRLYLSKKENPQTLVSKIESYIMGAIKFSSQPIFAETSGSSQVQAFEDCLLNNPDAIFVHRLGAMAPLLRTNKKLPPVFFDLDDIEHVAFARGVNQLTDTKRKLIKYLLLPALCHGEHRAVRLAHRSFVCSDNDLNYLKRRWNVDGVVKVPNAVDIPSLQRLANTQTLLFIGSYSHKPNVDAVEFLIKSIWPLIHRKLPNAKLMIAGSPQHKIPSYQTRLPGIEFKGFVEDLEELYQQTQVVCAPILSGSGTRVKILEAAAYGKPIVSTTIGAEGLQMADEHDILIRDTPESFADACIRLLSDLDQCQKMGTAGRSVVMRNYDKENIKRMIREVMHG